MNKLKEHIIKHKKTYLTSIVSVLIVLVLTVTFAFFSDVIGDLASTDTDVVSGTTDNLQFIKGTPISIAATQESFAEGKGSLSASTTSSAKLTLSSTGTSASATYQVYFKISKNEYNYTSPTKEPEMILTITDPDGNEVTDIITKDIQHTTVTDVLTGNTVSGFDITDFDGIIRIKENHAISTTGVTTQDWTVTITYMNLATDQNANQGAVLDSEFILQKEIMPEPPHLFINAPSPYYYGPNTTVTCDNATATWNSWNNSIRISSLSKLGECTLSQSKTSTTNLNTYITSLAGTTSGVGEVVNENGIRYQGKNPNNYIWFNEEYWRIIGVFDDASHGQTGEQLVKIVRDNPIGGLAWDKSNTNDWNASSLKALLNTEYLNSTNGTGGDNCYGYSTRVSANCDYRETGIKDEYRGMIKEVTWYLGGIDSATTASEVYTAERSDTVYSGRPTEGTGKIGLMYLSDYGYSTLSPNCVRTTNLSGYGNNNCAGSSWLYESNNQWTITPRSSNYYNVWYVNAYGYASSHSASSGYGGSPVLYLETSVKYLDGSGSQSDPIIIEM